MSVQCCRQRSRNIYYEQKTPKWQKYILYTVGCASIFIAMWTTLRDVTSVEIQSSVPEDLKKLPGAIVGTDKLEDVYWRMKIRYTNEKTNEECLSRKLSVITHKNIYLDSMPMKESYIYKCETNEVILNARAVPKNSDVETVHCEENYAGISKTVARNYPFSLKYISGTTFTQQTKVIRDAADACIWLHAIDIVESRWD